MKQILNNFLVIQKTVSVTGEEHNRQSVAKRFSEDPKGLNQRY